jgi:glycosyltransferase involved in cell wall biosynthesis
MSKVLVITNMYPSSESPFFGVFVKNIVEAIRTEDVLVEVHAIYSHKSSKVVKLMTYIKFFVLGWVQILLNKDSMIYVHFILHSAIPVLLVPRFIKRRIIGHVHGSDINIIGDGIVSKIKRFIISSFIKRADLLIVPSCFYKKFLLQQFICDSNKVIVSPSGGVNLDMFYPINTAKNDAEKIKILFASRLIKAKGLSTLVGAFGRMNTQQRSMFELTIVGDGPYKQWMQDSLKKFFSDDVVFTGMLAQEELAKNYNQADYFLFPSEMESLGLVGLEAMACSLPVLAPLNSGISDYLQDGVNGYKFAVNDENSLYELLCSLPLKKLNYKSLALNALNTAKKYDSKKVSLSLVKEIVGVTKVDMSNE